MAFESDTLTPTRPAAAAPVSRLRLKRLLIQSLGISAFYGIVLIFFSIKAPSFLSGINAAGILAVAGALGLVAIGQTFVIIVGGFDLSVGGIVPLCAVVYGLTINAHGIVIATVLSLGVGCVAGVVNGIIVAKLNINALIGTLATLSVSGGLAYVVTDGLTESVTASGGGFWGENAFWLIQNGVLALAAVGIVGAAVLRYTTFGRSVFAIGGNREAAELAGIRCDLVKIEVYVLSGGCAAFGGILLTSQLLASAPNVGTDTTLNSIAAVVLGGASLAGGVGGVPGTIVGVLLLGTIANGLSLMQVASFYQTIITGGVLLLAVGFARIRETMLQVLR
jgi:ribose transport system permease protein